MHFYILLSVQRFDNLVSVVYGLKPITVTLKLHPQHLLALSRECQCMIPLCSKCVIGGRVLLFRSTASICASSPYPSHLSRSTPSCRAVWHPRLRLNLPSASRTSTSVRPGYFLARPIVYWSNPIYTCRRGIPLCFSFLLAWSCYFGTAPALPNQDLTAISLVKQYSQWANLFSMFRMSEHEQ